MIINIALLFFVFGAEKKKISPYFAGILLGIIKGALVGMVARAILPAIVEAVYYAACAIAFVFFLKRIDRHEDKERPLVPTYSTSSSEKAAFKWEYVPLIVLLLAIIGGDIILASIIQTAASQTP